jgi:hypothetical protein
LVSFEKALPPFVLIGTTSFSEEVTPERKEAMGLFDVEVGGVEREGVEGEDT